ncbi:hypothetical protein PoB_001266100 [Plakobranchus ocellatus]|uniref:Uncharacterized protein n=1 Tax=Plakobranchus ocellatus TaxID=259542 RepID=A0AAV3YUX7_9GAST|nr:hypothetical protein PoB_001266100 [Plakobranchus ocellatus]
MFSADSPSPTGYSQPFEAFATPAYFHLTQGKSNGGKIASESALRSAGTILSRVRALPQAPWCEAGPENLRSPCCGLAIQKPKPTD